MKGISIKLTEGYQLSPGEDDFIALECQNNAAAIPISRLPPLPSRGSGYWVEPWMGIFLVVFFCVMLVSATTSMGMAVAITSRHVGHVLVTLIWFEAFVAVGCTLFLLFGGAGEITRSSNTCYPLPPEVEQKLIAGESLEGMRNIDGPADLGSFCTRCCVWRPKKASHHCKICQRCVSGFDHHCGIFGRCIVSGNMPCFDRHAICGLNNDHASNGRNSCGLHRQRYMSKASSFSRIHR